RYEWWLPGFRPGFRMSSCLRKAGVGGVTRKFGLVDRTSQPHDLVRQFQTTLNARAKRDVTRGVKVIKT
ncbi:MAG: hypothetical protein PV344_06875, partial [Anaplasma sp.]|nr:hypothetical protein [Anaplasma sp.]